jgi:hypothetical protein
VPHQARWEQQRNTDRQAGKAAGAQGLLGLFALAELDGQG